MRTRLLLAGLLIAGASIQAQSVTSTPTGFTTGSCMGTTDTLVSLPFSRPPEFIGAIASVSGTTLTISGTTGWQNKQFVYGTTLTDGSFQHNHYYALIGTREVALSGSINLTSGTNRVTGVGTTFTSAVSASDGLILTGSVSGYYIVQSVTNDTTLVLTGSARTTLTGQTAADSNSVLEGYTFEVTGNSTNGSSVSTVTLDTNGVDIAGIVPTTQVSIIPYWTLNTVFPASDSGISFTPTSGRTSQTEILMPNYLIGGINNGAGTVYQYSASTSQWTGGSSTTPGDDTFPPDGYFTLRNSQATPTTLTIMGTVVMQKLAVPLMSGTTPQDNYVSIARPLPVALNDLNLTGSDGVFTPTVGRTNGDQLFLYPTTVAGLNNGATDVYFYKAGIWTTGTNDRGGDVLPAGAAIIIRKAATPSGPTAQFWINPPTY